MTGAIQFEARLLVLSFLTGAWLMVLYDGLRLFRLLVRHGWLWTGVEDLLYWMFSGFVTFYLLYRENDGALRLYVIGTVLLAMVLYDRVCSRFFLKLLKKMGRCFRMKAWKHVGKKDSSW